jgi:hypothetical protein
VGEKDDAGRDERRENVVKDNDSREKGVIEKSNRENSGGEKSGGEKSGVENKEDGREHGDTGNQIWSEMAPYVTIARPGRNPRFQESYHLFQIREQEAIRWSEANRRNHSLTTKGTAPAEAPAEAVKKAKKMRKRNALSKNCTVRI